MGVYWFASSLKKDSAYISGEIKCEGFYEINISKCMSHEVRRVEIRGGINKLNNLNNYLDKQYIRSPSYTGFIDNLFYLYSSDGDRYRRDNNDGGVFAFGYDPKRIMEYVKIIGGSKEDVDDSLPLDEYEQAMGLQELFLVLEEAIEEDYIMFFYWQ